MSLFPTMRRGVLERFRRDEDAALAALLDDPTTGILVLDAAGLVVRANATARRMCERIPDLHGLAAAELFASGWDSAAPVLAGASAASSFSARLATGVPVRASIAALPGRDRRLSGAVLRLADTSDQERLRATLEEGEKLRAVGQLAAGVAHDFNNLLTVVLGGAEAIAARPGQDAETLADAEAIRGSAERGAALVRQLVALGRQQRMVPRVLAVNRAVEEVAAMMRRLLPEQIRLVVELERPGRSVRVDPTQLDQVLVNLTVNARDAMKQGGTLVLRTGHATLLKPETRGAETVPPGRYVTIEVVDSGAGIDPEVLPRIFDPFFTTRREQGGSGLGLATVHGIVRQSGGFIEVASTPGQGTCFRILLPRCDDETAAPAADPPPPNAPTPPPAERRVLLVEDEDPVRRLAERALARQGWRVLSAGSAEAALEAIDGQDIDAVVTDMVMPGMDGLALIAAVRARLGRPGLPAVVVSGYAEQMVTGAADPPNMVFLAKPYTVQELAARLGALVG